MARTATVAVLWCSVVEDVNRAWLAISLGVFVGWLFGAAPYDRDDWSHWSAGEVEGDRLDARQEMLVRASLVPVEIECGWTLPGVLAAPAQQYRIERSGPRRCRVASGRWLDDYTGVEIVASTGEEVARLVTVEHVVPLAEAHRSGGHCWDRERRRQFANDRRFLLIISRSMNGTRSDTDVFLPWHRPCRFVRLYVAAKAEYELGYDLAEGSFFADQLALCISKGGPW